MSKPVSPLRQMRSPHRLLLPRTQSASSHSWFVKPDRIRRIIGPHRTSDDRRAATKLGPFDALFSKVRAAVSGVDKERSLKEIATILQNVKTKTPLEVFAVMRELHDQYLANISIQIYSRETVSQLLNRCNNPLARSIGEIGIKSCELRGEVGVYFHNNEPVHFTCLTPLECMVIEQDLLSLSKTSIDEGPRGKPTTLDRLLKLEKSLPEQAAQKMQNWAKKRALCGLQMKRLSTLTACVKVQKLESGSIVGTVTAKLTDERYVGIVFMRNKSTSSTKMHIRIVNGLGQSVDNIEVGNIPEEINGDLSALMLTNDHNTEIGSCIQPRTQKYLATAIARTAHTFYKKGTTIVPVVVGGVEYYAYHCNGYRVKLHASDSNILKVEDFANVDFLIYNGKICYAHNSVVKYLDDEEGVFKSQTFQSVMQGKYGSGDNIVTVAMLLNSWSEQIEGMINRNQSEAKWESGVGRYFLLSEKELQELETVHKGGSLLRQRLAVSVGLYHSYGGSELPAFRIYSRQLKSGDMLVRSPFSPAMTTKISGSVVKRPMPILSDIRAAIVRTPQSNVGGLFGGGGVVVVKSDREQGTYTCKQYPNPVNWDYAAMRKMLRNLDEYHVKELFAYGISPGTMRLYSNGYDKYTFRLTNCGGINYALWRYATLSEEQRSFIPQGLLVELEKASKLEIGDAKVQKILTIIDQHCVFKALIQRCPFGENSFITHYVEEAQQMSFRQLLDNPVEYYNARDIEQLPKLMSFMKKN